MSRAGFSLPDFRNVERGVTWLQKMIEASERMDSGDASAMDTAINSMTAPRADKREREPGEDDN